MVKRLRAFLAANWLALRVLVTFVVLIFVFFFVLDWEPILAYVDIGRNLARIAALAAWGILRGLGRPLGFDPHLSGTILSTGDFTVEVSPACSGAVPTSIYLAAVLAYPTGWSARGLGALIGVLAINFINVFRVVALFLIGLYAPGMFHETHVYVAQALLICVAVAAWMYWVSRFADAPAV